MTLNTYKEHDIREKKTREKKENIAWQGINYTSETIP